MSINFPIKRSNRGLIDTDMFKISLKLIEMFKDEHNTHEANKPTHPPTYKQ